MSSQPSGGPSIPAAAAVAGLDSDTEDSAQERDEGVPVGAADVEADKENARERSDNPDDKDVDFVTADVDEE